MVLVEDKQNDIKQQFFCDVLPVDGLRKSKRA